MELSEILRIIAADMEDKHLYIISGPNGAGKTTASYSILPKILHCKEFVNANEIARGLSPFNPESVAILRRYYEGIDNLFQIYMPIVDTWILVNNSETPRSIVASGGKNQELLIRNSVSFNQIKEYVKRRT